MVDINMINKQEKLIVLEKAHELTVKIYKLTASFPKTEQFRLVDQLCRSMSSVPANIAEGNSRQTKKEFIQFLYQAKGSLAETQYHLRLAKDLKYITEKDYINLIGQCDEVGRLISGLLNYLRSTI
jgi:four helix bundle protein